MKDYVESFIDQVIGVFLWIGMVLLAFLMPTINFLLFGIILAPIIIISAFFNDDIHLVKVGFIFLLVSGISWIIFKVLDDKFGF